MISEFTGRHRWLSNFALVFFEYEGITYPSTEHAYQAAKSTVPAVRERISKMPRPGDAKKAGKLIMVREDWDSVKLSIMEEILRLKFAIPAYRDLLLDTGDEELVEGNYWGDVFWGVCHGKGENHLGKLIMKIRAEYQADSRVLVEREFNKLIQNEFGTPNDVLLEEVLPMMMKAYDRGLIDGKKKD